MLCRHRRRRTPIQIHSHMLAEQYSADPLMRVKHVQHRDWQLTEVYCTDKGTQISQNYILANLSRPFRLAAAHLMLHTQIPFIRRWGVPKRRRTDDD